MLSEDQRAKILASALEVLEKSVDECPREKAVHEFAEYQRGKVMWTIKVWCDAKARDAGREPNFLIAAER